LRAQSEAGNVYFKSYQDMPDTSLHRSGRAVGATRTNFLSVRSSFLEDMASMPAKSSAIIIASLRHHFSFTSLPRLRDWEFSLRIHTSCASPGHKIPRRRSRAETRLQQAEHLTSRMTHMTKIKIALVAALIAATSSAAFAASKAVDQNDWFAVEQSDRASSPYAGGN
jgi:hypothetical protein